MLRAHPLRRQMRGVGPTCRVWGPVVLTHLQATPGKAKESVGVQREAFFGEHH